MGRLFEEEMKKFFSNPFAKSKGPRSVNDILSQFNDTVAELQEREKAQRDEAIRQDEIIAQAAVDKANAEEEAVRAANVAQKIQDLIA